MKSAHIFFCCLVVWSPLILAQPSGLKEGERAVVKIEEKSHSKKTITEVFKGEVLIRKITEEQRTGDRPLQAKHTRWYRDRQEVLFELWDSKSNETTRYFMEEKRLVMAEMDRDGDGVFEWLIIFGKDEKISNVFKRAPDGKIQPLDAESLATFKQGSEITKELFSR